MVDNSNHLYGKVNDAQFDTKWERFQINSKNKSYHNSQITYQN